ncbi:hypothetical protein BJ742DRAFT_677800 [Cladochytrium replicatum]|nr:hypothetical protein BJ742DRAFT_677800 [Cladochytrium replicatum]
MDSETQLTRSRSAVSFVLLVFAIVAFVVQSEIVQYIQGKLDYNKPWFLLVNNDTTVATESSPLLPERTTNVRRLSVGERRLVLWLLFTTAIKLATVFSVASYAWYVAVTRISMPDLTAIYDSSCVFVYILSVIMLRYRAKISKSFAVIITMVGIGFISGWATPPNGNTGEPDGQSLHRFPFSPIVGFTAAILSSVGAALCEVLFKKWAVPANPHPPSTFLSFFFTGMIGLVSFMFLWVGFPILHYTGFETFDPIPTENLGTWAVAVGLNAFSGLSYNVSFNLLVATAVPVFASFGIMLTIPIMGVSDSIATGNPVGTGTMIGSACILVGFAILSFQAED